MNRRHVLWNRSKRCITYECVYGAAETIDHAHANERRHKREEKERMRKKNHVNGKHTQNKWAMEWCMWIVSVCGRRTFEWNGIANTIPMECAIVNYCRHADRELGSCVCVQYHCSPNSWHIGKLCSPSKMSHRIKINRSVLRIRCRPKIEHFSLWVNVIVHTEWNWIY